MTNQSALHTDASIGGRATIARAGAAPLWFVVAAVALVVALLVPFATTPIPPLLDYPNHYVRLWLLALVILWLFLLVLRLGWIVCLILGLLMLRCWGGVVVKCSAIHPCTPAPD